MMKKTILFSLMFVLLVGLVQAQGLTPHPVYGKVTVDDKPMINGVVTITHVHSGKVAVVSTNKFGDYQISLANLAGDQWRSGDDLEVNFCDANLNSMCTQIIKVSSRGGTRINALIFVEKTPPVDVPGDDDIIIVDKPDTPVVVDTPLGTVLAKDWVDAFKIWWFPGFLMIMILGRLAAGRKRWNTFWSRFAGGRYDKYKRKTRR